jgi:hypothetical protein
MVTWPGDFWAGRTAWQGACHRRAAVEGRCFLCPHVDPLKFRLPSVPLEGCSRILEFILLTFYCWTFFFCFFFLKTNFFFFFGGTGV